MLVIKAYCHHWVAPMVLQVVSEAIENTDVNIGLDNNGQLQVAVLPKDQEKVNWAICGGKMAVTQPKGGSSYACRIVKENITFEV